MMRRISLSLLAATAMGVIACQGASAADMRMPVKAPAPLPPPVQDWSGVYVGLEGGYGWGKQNFDQALDPFFLGKLSSESCKELDVASPACTHPTIGSVSQSGWLFGGHAGVQKQWGSWVLGIDASIDAADIKGDVTSAITNQQLFYNSNYCGSSPSPCRVRTVNSSQSLDSKIDLLGYVGPKVGWAWSPNWMIYATGGLAFGHKEDDWSADQTHFFTRFGTTFPTRTDLAFNGDGGVSMFGWAVGGGLDYKWQLDAGSAVVFGIQYLHYQFGKDTLTLSANGTVFGEAGNLSIGLPTTETVDVIKGRISYLFSIH
jgi:outer membrane immunogenic protein